MLQLIEWDKLKVLPFCLGSFKVVRLDPLVRTEGDAEVILIHEQCSLNIEQQRQTDDTNIERKIQ